MAVGEESGLPEFFIGKILGPPPGVKILRSQVKGVRAGLKTGPECFRGTGGRQQLGDYSSTNFPESADW
jgi:hypothetical protein